MKCLPLFPAPQGSLALLRWSRTDFFLKIALVVGDFAFLLLSALAVLSVRLWPKVSHVFIYLFLKRRRLSSSLARRQTSACRGRALVQETGRSLPKPLGLRGTPPSAKTKREKGQDPLASPAPHGVGHSRVRLRALFARVSMLRASAHPTRAMRTYPARSPRILPAACRVRLT